MNKFKLLSVTLGVISVVLLSALLLVACGNSDSGNTTSTNTSRDGTYTFYSITYTRTGLTTTNLANIEDIGLTPAQIVSVGLTATRVYVVQNNSIFRAYLGGGGFIPNHNSHLRGDIIILEQSVGAGHTVIIRFSRI